MSIGRQTFHDRKTYRNPCTRLVSEPIKVGSTFVYRHLKRQVIFRHNRRLAVPLAPSICHRHVERCRLFLWAVVRRLLSPRRRNVSGIDKCKFSDSRSSISPQSGFSAVHSRARPCENSLRLLRTFLTSFVCMNGDRCSIFVGRNAY